jgi:hypothetical protein
MGKPVNQEFSAAMTKPIKTAKALNLLLQGQRVADVLLLDIETQKSGFRRYCRPKVALLCLFYHTERMLHTE